MYSVLSIAFYLAFFAVMITCYCYVLIVAV
nr:MAG TPA: hypothetical protein [Bacteriophage sp.]